MADGEWLIVSVTDPFGLKIIGRTGEKKEIDNRERKMQSSLLCYLFLFFSFSLVECVDDPHKVLGVPYLSSKDEIKEAYDQLVRK